MSGHEAPASAAGESVTRVLWLSIVRTFVPVIVGGVLGRFAAAGIEADPNLAGDLEFWLTIAGSGLYYVAARVFEVYVSPRFGWLLGAATSPDAYSPAAPTVGRPGDDGMISSR